MAQSIADTISTDNLYEGMFLLESGKFASNPEGATQHVLDILERSGATVVAHRPWQDGRLAYEIEKQRKGLHYLVCFRMPGRGVSEITRSCKLSEFVLRHLVIKHPQSLFDAMVNTLAPGEDLTEAEDSTRTEIEAETAIAVEDTNTMMPESETESSDKGN